MKKNSLTKSEREVMQLLWQVHRPLTASEITKLSTDKTWKDSYVHLILSSLIKKEMIDAVGYAQATKIYARTFAATVTAEQYAARQILADCDGSPTAVAAVVKNLIEESQDPDAVIEAIEKVLLEATI